MSAGISQGKSSNCNNWNQWQGLSLLLKRILGPQRSAPVRVLCSPSESREGRHRSCSWLLCSPAIGLGQACNSEPHLLISKIRIMVAPKVVVSIRADSLHEITF